MFIAASLVLSGCSTLPKPKVDSETVNLVRSQTEMPASELLDVRIEVFDPGVLPESEELARGLSMEIRQAEARYIPVELKNAIEQTGHWGSVRVVPAQSPGDEVLLTGRILRSNGESLELEVSAHDAAGQRWFTKAYAGAVDVKMHEKADRQGLEAFQNVYNRIANDLATYRLQLTPIQVRRIKQIAELRFAEEMAPAVFSGYLKKAEGVGAAQTSGQFMNLGVNPAQATSVKDFFSQLKGGDGSQETARTVYVVDRLPAEDDDMLLRLRRIRESDDLLVDTLHGHYEGLHLQMQDTYAQWRVQRTKEIYMIREVEQKQKEEVAKGIATVLVAVMIGVAAGNNDNSSFNSGLAGASGAIAAEGVRKVFEASGIDEEAEINRAALEELGESFSADVEPIVVDVDGETVELTGTAEAKYRQWRELLGRLYTSETGFSPDVAIESAPVSGND